MRRAFLSGELLGVGELAAVVQVGERLQLRRGELSSS